MGKSLGQIEAVAKAVDREPDYFDMLEERFFVVRRPSLVESLKSAAISADEELSDDERFSRQTNLAHHIFQKCLAPESYDRFLKVCEDNELGVDVLWQTVQLLVGAAAGKAQEKRDGSSDGPSNISTSSSSEPVGLLDYAEKGLHLVPAEDWADRYLATA